MPLPMQCLSFLAHALIKCTVYNYRIYHKKDVKLLLYQKIIVTEWKN